MDYRSSGVEMELVQAQEKMSVNPIGMRIAGVLVQLSMLSLGIGITFIPWRYAWILQQRQSPPVYIGYTTLILYLADIPLLLALMLWLMSMAVKPRRISLEPRLLTLALGGLVLISALSSISSVDRVVSMYRSTQLLLLFGLYLYLINEIHSPSLLWIPAGLGVLIQAVVVFGQILNQHSLGLVGLQELSLDPAWKGVSIVLAAGTRTLRAYGLTDHPNILGGCLVFAMLLLMVGFLNARAAWRVLIAGLFVLGALALLLTFSRAAWLGLSAGVVFIGLWLGASRCRALFLAWVGLCAGTLLLLLPLVGRYAPFLDSRLNLDGSFSAATPENQSINERWLLLSQASRLIVQHPLTGVGLGAYPQALQQAVPDYPFDYQPPHMVLAEVTAETGLVGGVVYLVLLAAPWVLLLRSRKRMRLSLQLAGFSALLLAVSVISFLDYYPWLSNAGSIWQWLGWGLWGGVYQNIISGREA
jgi:putative inorganic carbon (hco3(-)) transporter